MWLAADYWALQEAAKCVNCTPHNKKMHTLWCEHSTGPQQPIGNQSANCSRHCLAVCS